MICGVDDQQEYVQGERYKVHAKSSRKEHGKTRWGYKAEHETDYIYVGSTRGCGVIHYVFRSCAGGWLESFSDLLILLGEIDIRPHNRKGKRQCNAQIAANI